MRFPASGPALDRRLVESYFFWFCVARLANREMLVEELLNAGMSGVLSQAVGTNAITYVEYMGYTHIASRECFIRAYTKDRCVKCGRTAKRCVHCLDKRLAFDPNVSHNYPVIRGTWITVDTIYDSVVVGAEPYDTFIRAHPEVSREDIEAAVAYMM